MSGIAGSSNGALVKFEWHCVTKSPMTFDCACPKFNIKFLGPKISLLQTFIELSV